MALEDDTGRFLEIPDEAVEITESEDNTGRNPVGGVLGGTELAEEEETAEAAEVELEVLRQELTAAQEQNEVLQGELTATIGVKMIAFRLKYFTHKFEVFDGIIVVISWSLDVASIVQEEAFEAAALLIVLRLWRVVRIINGVLLSSQTQAEKKFDKAKKEAKSVIHAFHKGQDKMDEFEEENINLKKQLAKQKLAEKPVVNSYKLSSSSEESSTGL